MKPAMSAVIAAAALVATKTLAQSARDYPDIRDSSFIEADGHRVMQFSVIVPAPRAQVWQALTTSRGYRTWATPLASVDFRVGGIIETNYNAGARLGSPDNIKNEITAYLPERLIVLRNIQAPKAFTGATEFAQTAVIIELDARRQHTTEVTLSQVGWGSGPVFDTLYKEFAWAQPYSLNELKHRFEVGPVDWAARKAKEKAASTDRKVEEGTKP